MIWPILFLRVLTILIFFPGIFYQLYDKTIGTRLGTTDKFVLSLITAACLSLILVRDRMLLIVLVVALLVPVIQVVVELHSFKYLKKVFKQKKFLLQTLILIPFLEEYIFRYVLYELLMEHDVPGLFYIIFSALVFVFLHYYQLKGNAFYKGVLGVMLAAIFLFTGNLFLVILIHVVFNVIVYLLKYTNHYTGYEV
ncbi:CPBP family intramembrane glutamic endopeptidase [Lentibacillus saliphilus]|uniref:CPBP family intramembrane glutamic endopeptidase n=1 Tax=Lentibacillus saliphilus TaxID=2737028 RepID=UPI001C2F4EAF|nr:CPBP family intramembrane glutamic endopeptidase [Lentibacillus saliphilus]